ncbi:MAG: NADH-quinone oxidoreductase subunit L [Streptosporangiales bacterium]|nr:NADH-quinone oxidoreductase subunit L [Streptosporangiales bacterium]
MTAALIIVLPFLAAVVGLLWGPRLPFGPAGIAVVATGASTVLTTLVALGQFADPGVAEAAVVFTPTGDIPITLGTRVDGLSATVAVMVGAVALAVQVYSIGYMRGDPRYSSYAAFISLFTAAMLLVVLSADLLTLYVGWEVMGLCSYLLIGHYWYDRLTSGAAVKAFLMTRLGDVGFLFGIFVLGYGAGSFRVGDVLAAAGEMPEYLVVLGTLLLLCGVVGKSAQFPLHSWLPDAMVGPTPISALIHAATMVAAGMYVVARLHPAFLAAPLTLNVLGVVAAVSMLGSALAALAQDDLKRVLAYSTISQLAVMGAGLAVGARPAGVFHLLTHGAFKALLFLCAGAVITAVGSNLMSEMGGLRRGMPVTFWTMTIGLAALIGLPPTSGFFSKDAIVAAAERAAGGGAWFAYSPISAISGSVAWIVLVAVLATIAATAAYATRAWLRTFFGPARFRTAIREAPPVMRWPLVVLAVPSLLLGFFGLPVESLRPEAASSLLALLCAAAGALLVYAVWRFDPAADPVRALGPAARVFARAFGVDELYDAAVVRPTRRLARGVLDLDLGVVDAAVVRSGRTARSLGGVLRVLQNGNPQLYVTGVLAGALLIVVSVAVLS